LNTPLHLEESLQRDIDLLRSKVSEMARLSERALSASVRALVEGNRQLAYSVILRDQYIDELETELDRLCLEFLVRHQPAGAHLRFVYTTIQINKEIERIGDYAESIARQSLHLISLEAHPQWERFIELGNLATQMLRDAVQAFLKQDADLAWRTMAIEEEANSLRNTINAEIGELSRKALLPAAAVTPLLTVARRLERTADQAKNFCEDVLYFCTGEFIKHSHAEGFRILFVDWGNACLSQMAEAIGRSLGLAGFTFSSAGIQPQTLSARAIEFMAHKGIDISRQTSKSLDQVRQKGTPQVVIALGARVRDALPPCPGKIIVLTWPINDPVALLEPPAAVESALETAFQSLESNIRDLAGAILEEPKQQEEPYAKPNTQ